MNDDEIHFDVRMGCYFGDWPTVGNKLWSFCGPILDAFEECGFPSPELSLAAIFHYARKYGAWRWYVSAEFGALAYPEVWH